MDAFDVDRIYSQISTYCESIGREEILDAPQRQMVRNIFENHVSNVSSTISPDTLVNRRVTASGAGASSLEGVSGDGASENDALTTDQINLLLERIAGDDHVSRMVAMAYLETNREIVDQLMAIQYLEILSNNFYAQSSEDGNDINAISAWLERQEVQNTFTFDTVLNMPLFARAHLTAILAQLPEDRRTELHNAIYERLNADDLRLFSSEIPPLSNEGRALYYSCKKTKMSEIKHNDSNFRLVLPHLPYVYLDNDCDPYIIKMVLGLERVQHVVINNDKVRTISGNMRNCRTFRCFSSDALELITAQMPNCTTFICTDCKALIKVPNVLPSGKWVECYTCSGLAGDLPNVPGDCRIITEPTSFEYFTNVCLTGDVAAGEVEAHSVGMEEVEEVATSPVIDHTQALRFIDALAMGFFASETNEDQDQNSIIRWLDHPQVKRVFSSKDIMTMPTEALLLLTAILAQLPEEQRTEAHQSIYGQLDNGMLLIFSGDWPLSSIKHIGEKNHVMLKGLYYGCRKIALSKIMFDEDNAHYIIPYMPFVFIDKKVDQAMALWTLTHGGNKHLLVNNDLVNSVVLKTSSCLSIKCVDCKQLQVLSGDFSNCEVITCIDCPQLARLPRPLGVCKLLNCCPFPSHQAAVPELPEDCTLVFDNSSEEFNEALTGIVQALLYTEDVPDVGEVAPVVEIDLPKALDLLNDLVANYFTTPIDSEDKGSIIRWLDQDDVQKTYTADLIKSLPKEDLAYLTGILAQLPEDYRERYQSIYSQLDQRALEFFPSYEHDDFLNGLDDAERFMYVAIQYTCKKTELSAFGNTEELLPFLRFAYFDPACSSELLEKVLNNSKLLQHAVFSSDDCETLNINLSGLLSATFQKCNCLSEVKGDLSSCRVLKFTECPKISNITLELSNCRQFSVISCPSLISIPKRMDNCELFEARDCPNLMAIPSNLRKCAELDIRWSENIESDIPEVPQYCLVYGAPMHWDLLQDVSMYDLETIPKELLLRLGRDQLLIGLPFPRIRYNTRGVYSEAVDLGGVSRDFLSRLMAALFTTSDSADKLPISDGRWPEGDVQNEQISNCYRTLGRIFALCCPERSFFKTGDIFSEDVFKAIAAFKNPQLDSPDDWIDAYLIKIGAPSTLRNIFDQNTSIEEATDVDLNYAAYLYDEDSSLNNAREFFSNPQNRTDLKAIIYSKAQAEQSVQVVSTIAKEMYGALGEEEWAKIIEAPMFAERIQGSLSPEKLIKAIFWKTKELVEGEDIQKVVSEEDSQKTAGFIQQWINNASLDDLRKFVFGVTGNNALGNENITIELFNRADQIPISHTCSNWLEVSAQYKDQEQFEDRLRLFFKYALKGFDSK